MTATANEIRSAFLGFFRDNGHHAVDSSPLVPRNDPSLLFTNSGMVQFKNFFTGAETPPWPRAVTAQKCLRAGGKHNDLENVGYTARHHTFFEMLGNFSFGDYFKDRAIELAWTMVTRELGLSRDRLLVTVYSEDHEAAALWRKIAGLGDDRIIRISTSDNFWQMGDTGPCGPCTEIFYDHGPGIPGGPPGSPDEDGDRFIEIWNLVFMQYEQFQGGERRPLPNPSIDTGMGLERIAAVLQGKHNNYDTDLLRHIILSSATLTGVDPDGPCAVSHRVVADHLRAAAFLIADGVLPSNEGRGYVLRRIMRRGMRHAHILGAQEPLMWRLVPALIAKMGGHYGELERARSLITETLKLEETRFRNTLARGLRLLEDETAGMAPDGVLPGRVAFTLYDTYGFPLDLTQDILRGQGRRVDSAGFDAEMRQQKERARKAWAGSGEQATDSLWFDLRDRLGLTEFLGYETERAEAVVSAIVQGGEVVTALAEGGEAAVLTNQTPFYGESGGQAGDRGLLRGPDGALFRVADTQKKAGGLVLHLGRLEKGRLNTGAAVQMQVDGDRRARLRANHSVTHLAHAALRQVLGDHVTQRGSLVEADAMRFDFAHPAALSAAEAARVEDLVNAQIRANAPVTVRLMTPEDAIADGALALFGEKYGDEVRVVAMRGRDPAGAKDATYSVELCGGTHVARTGDIGLFRIVAEAAVAAGVRRIECLTGQAALDHDRVRGGWLAEAAALLRATPADVPARLESLVEERKRLDRDVSELRRKLAEGQGGDGQARRQVGGVNFLSRLLQDMPPRDLRPLADSLKRRIGSGVIALAAVSEGRVSLLVAVTDDLTGSHSAVDLVRAGAAAIGGAGGGGRPDMAQAGGGEGADAAKALQAIENRLSG